MYKIQPIFYDVFVIKGLILHISCRVQLVAIVA